MLDVRIFIKEHGIDQKPKSIRQLTTTEWLIDAPELQLLVTEHNTEYIIQVRQSRGTLHRDVYINGVKVLDNVPDTTLGVLKKPPRKINPPLTTGQSKLNKKGKETLSALVITRDAESRIGMILEQFREVGADEIVCIVNNKSRDNTAGIARQIATKVVMLDFKGHQVIEPILNEAHKKCTGDWILRVDDDELLGMGFKGIKDKISEIEANGIFFPRYNCVTGTKKFINTEPWYPDWQLRLYRRSALKLHRGHTHVPVSVEGQTIKLDSCHLIHLLYQERTYADRLGRTRHYDYDHYPTLPIRQLQIFEDYTPEWEGNVSSCKEMPIIRYEGFDFNLVQVQTTSICPARCVICGYKDGSWMLGNKGRMSSELYSGILRNLSDLDPLFDGKFCPYLMNEPFADPRMISRVKEAFDTLYNPFIEVSTNAALLNSKKIAELVGVYENNNFNGIVIISHFGVDERSFEATMSLKYEKCLNNMVELIKAFDGRMKIRVNNLGVSCDDRMTLFPQQQIDRYMANIINEHSLPTKNLNIPRVRFHNRAGNAILDGWNCKRTVREIDSTHPFDCFRVHNNLHVLWNGEVVLCCMDYHHEECFGDLSKNRIEEVFRSPEWNLLKDKVNGKCESAPNFLCKRCLSPGG